MTSKPSQGFGNKKFDAVRAVKVATNQRQNNFCDMQERGNPFPWRIFTRSHRERSQKKALAFGLTSQSFPLSAI